MFSHEYFRELSALSAIGQLSREEDEKLAQHLRACSSCQDAHLEYARVIQQQLPHADVIRWRIRSANPMPFADADLRTRFLARARTEGVDFSQEAERPQLPNSYSHPEWRRSAGLWPGLAVAALAILAVCLTWVGTGSKRARHATGAVADARSSQPAREYRAFSKQLSDLRQQVIEQSSTIALMKKENAGSLESLAQLQKQLGESRLQVESLSADLQQMESQNSALASASEEKNATIDNLRAQDDNLSRERADMLTSMVALESQVRNLTSSVEEKSANLERERQLTAASMDVRQLMGARNLHILDVRDVEGGGKDAKAFGRVFYAEGQSLVFYAFDLPSAGGNPAKYTFQAWGQREPGPQSVRNLGTFEVDDHDQRRWVLTVNDPALLAGIDSVFVTSESLRDSKEPRGKKVMYAYIAGQPNHP
jgi:hypothetical protein